MAHGAKRFEGSNGHQLGEINFLTPVTSNDKLLYKAYRIEKLKHSRSIRYDVNYDDENEHEYDHEDVTGIIGNPHRPRL
jgi:hypothetical protein